MGKFNNNIEVKKTQSYEGAELYAKNPVEDWINFLFSSTLENQCYESAGKQMNRYIELTQEVAKTCGWEFVAKASFFARNELGMRSISELTAAILNGEQFDNKRAYFRNYFHRPDGVAEVFSAVDMLGGKRSHALIRGASDYLSSLGEYQIGKYKMNGKKYNMYDLINITHAHSAAIDEYKAGALETPDTWETAISASNSEEEKAENWVRLVEEHKLGYLALIRNLRNIIKARPDIEWIKSYLIPQITDETSIKKSLVFPYQIYCAWKNIELHNYDIEKALDSAFKTSCGNVPKMEGCSLVVLDVSGSMESSFSANSSLTMKEVGAVYAAVLLIANHADFIKFGSMAISQSYSPLENVFDIISKMQRNDGCGYSTNITSVFELIDETPYDRIFLVSDMQVISVNLYRRGRWIEPMKQYKHYCVANKVHPQLYSFDLANYSSQISNPNDNHVHLLTALNDQFFKMLPYIEDGGSLVDYINNNFSYC